MNYVGRRVSHARFGEGVVKSCENGLMQILFQDSGARNFHYPEAFEHFLKAEDRDFETEIAENLNTWRQSREAASQRAAEACALLFNPPKPEKVAKPRAPRAPKKPAKAKT